jgi:hypothetical protein
MNGVYVKGIALTFNLLSWVLHLKPTAVCQILTSISGMPSITGEFAVVSIPTKFVSGAYHQNSPLI